MQQHPIPRNITGFQFKLIGDMTLKQFGYLAGGIIVGYILFRALPLPGVLRLSVLLLFGGSGAALAFLPLQGRPLDVWIKAYFKNVYSPTQFVWKKQNLPPEILAQPIKAKRRLKKTPSAPKEQPAEPDKRLSRRHYAEVEEKLTSYLKNAGEKPHEALDKREKKALKQTEAVMQRTGGGKWEVRGGTPEQKTDKHKVTPASTEDVIRERVKKELEQQYKEELEHLKREKVQIEKKMRGLETPGTTDQEERPLSLDEQAHLRILSQEEVAQAGLPLYVDQPNIIVGTIIDPQEQQLPGILVTIKNKRGRIVRALKTNNLGQFVSLTPLPNGEYVLEAEDPNGRFKFDIIRVRLHGKIFPPIAIIGKTKEESKQDEIRKKLFARQSTSEKS